MYVFPKIYVFRKTSKKQKLTVALQNYTKISLKRLYKNLSYLFFMNFFPNIFFATFSKHFLRTFSKTSKKQLLIVLQNHAKISFKRLYKKLSDLFSTIVFATSFKQTLSER